MRSILRATLACAMMALLSVGFSGCNGARDDALKAVGKGPQGFMIKTLVRGDRSRKYGLFVPLAYDSNQSYPVIIFLHGLGEGGSDAKANMRVGLAPFVQDKAATFPFICIFPQSSNGGWDENSDQAKDVIAELDAVSAEYHVDADRVSLTGLSTGGYGTWAIGAKYKDRFAALVPMGSSSSDNKDAKTLANMPIWAFHNSGDMFALSFNDSSMVAKIKSLGGHAAYTEYGAVGHDCWETAYKNGALFDWLLKQRRGVVASATPASPFVVATPVAVVPRSQPAYVQSNNNAAPMNTPY